MTDKPETVAASAVQDDAKDAARFRWLRDHAINTEGAKGSPWCVYGLDLGDCTPAFGAELVAMVDDAMANGIVCSPVPVESLGRDADDPATESSDDQSWSGMDGATAWHLIDRHAGNWAHFGQMMNAWLAANRVSAPLPASVPDGWRVIPFSGSFKSGDEKWEVYGPDGSGGAIGKSDVCWPVSDLLDAIAAAPPTSPIGDSLSLHGAAGQSVSRPPASAPEVTGAFGKLIETAKLLNRSFELKLSRDDRRELWSALGLPFGFSPNIAVIRAEAKEQFRAALTAALTEKSHG